MAITPSHTKILIGSFIKTLEPITGCTALVSCLHRHLDVHRRSVPIKKLDQENMIEVVYQLDDLSTILAHCRVSGELTRRVLMATIQQYNHYIIEGMTRIDCVGYNKRAEFSNVEYQQSVDSVKEWVKKFRTDIDVVDNYDDISLMFGTLKSIILDFYINRAQCIIPIYKNHIHIMQSIQLMEYWITMAGRDSYLDLKAIKMSMNALHYLLQLLKIE